MTLGSLRPFLRALALLVVPTLAVCVVALEVGLRLQGNLPSNLTGGIFEARGEAYRLKANQDKIFRTPSFSCRVRTNALGLRDRTTGNHRYDRPYLAWLGDSATFANGVEFEDSFVGRLAAHLQACDRDAANLAVGGHHLAEQEVALEDFLAKVPRRPDGVVVVFTPQLLALFDRHHQGLVFHDGNGYPKERWVVPYLLVTLGDASSAYCFFRDTVRRLQAKLVGSGRAAAEEVLRIYRRTYPAQAPGVAGRIEERVAALDRRIRDAGAVPLHVYLPTTADLRAPEILALAGRPAGEFDFDYYRDVLRRVSARGGVRLVDLTADLQAAYAGGEPLGFTRDMHYNARGHAVIAPALERDLLTQDGWIQAEQCSSPPPVKHN